MTLDCPILLGEVIYLSSRSKDGFGIVDPDWNLPKSKLWNVGEEGNKLAITNTLAGRNLGMILLAIWLILTGLLPLLNIRVSTTINTVLAVLAIAAGLLILLRR